MSKEIRTTEQILQEDFNWTVDGDPGRYSLFVNLIKPAMKAYHSQFTTPSPTVEQAAKEYSDLWMEADYYRNRCAAAEDVILVLEKYGIVPKKREQKAMFEIVIPYKKWLALKNKQP